MKLLAPVAFLCATFVIPRIANTTSRDAEARIEYAVTVDLSEGHGTDTKSLLLPPGRVQTRERGEVPLASIKIGEHITLDGDAGVVTALERRFATPARANAQRVIGVFKRVASTLMVVRTRADTVTTTPEHPFWVIGKGWVPAGRLERDDRLDAQTPLGYSTIESVEARPADNVPVYNLLVEGTHVYRVGREKLLVHNGCGPSREAGGSAGARPVAGAPTPVEGAPTTNTFDGDNTVRGGKPMAFASPMPTASGAASIQVNEDARAPSGRPQTEVTINPNATNNVNGYYLHWTPDGEQSTTLPNHGDITQFATAPLSGCAVRIQTNADGTVSVTHYNRREDQGDARYGSRYDAQVQNDAGNDNVQWILPGRDYNTLDGGPALLTGTRNADGEWEFQLRGRS